MPVVQTLKMFKGNFWINFPAVIFLMYPSPELCFYFSIFSIADHPKTYEANPLFRQIATTTNTTHYQLQFQRIHLYMPCRVLKTREKFSLSTAKTTKTTRVCSLLLSSAPTRVTLLPSTQTTSILVKLITQQLIAATIAIRRFRMWRPPSPQKFPTLYSTRAAAFVVALITLWLVLVPKDVYLRIKIQRIRTKTITLELTNLSLIGRKFLTIKTHKYWKLFE